ncbi:MAG: hypothetical protein H7138_09125 [Myxococcales bacterium]|nr:hypothetical protein [Myxococcales bacterium]
MRLPSSFVALVALIVLSIAGPARAAERGHEFIAEARTLLVVGACAEGAPPEGKAAIVAAHCKKVQAAQADYRKSWIAVARTFFAAHVPTNIPKTVVYPFAGGDLSTALTVFPDANEITTLSLEPAGDPTALARLSDKQLKTALAVVATELGSLYRANFSVTMNMIGAMRGGELPTQLIFSLSALVIHGYEPTSLRYFKLAPDGTPSYLTDADVERLAKLTDVGKRNREYANVELTFRRQGGAGAREQVYRHIQANLDDAHLKADPAALRHLEAKGTVAAMTKAASYLLTFGDFQTMRSYVIDHVAWMVSDTTGLPPSYGKKAGFAYETWGAFDNPNMAAGKSYAPEWRAEYAAQEKRPLPFRFGYPDAKHRGHLIIMSKPAAPAAAK